MANKLFSFKDRDASHKKLEEVLLEGKHPRAECRDDFQAGEFSVWDDGEVREPAPPVVQAATTVPGLSEHDINQIVDKLAVRLGVAK